MKHMQKNQHDRLGTGDTDGVGSAFGAGFRSHFLITRTATVVDIASHHRSVHIWWSRDFQRVVAHFSEFGHRKPILSPAVCGLYWLALGGVVCAVEYEGRIGHDNELQMRRSEMGGHTCPTSFHA